MYYMWSQSLIICTIITYNKSYSTWEVRIVLYAQLLRIMSCVTWGVRIVLVHCMEWECWQPTVTKQWLECSLYLVLFYEQDMGFSSAQAKEAIKKFSTVQAALDSLLAGVGRWTSVDSVSHQQALVKITNIWIHRLEMEKIYIMSLSGQG